jgi:protein tyrosine/serine phosphatase
MAINLRRALRPSKWNILGLVLVIGAVAAGAAVWDHHRDDTYRFDVVHPGVLYRDGNEDTEQFLKTLKTSDSRTVVCLVHDTELTDPLKKQLLPGLELAAKDGRQLMRVEVPLGTWPRTRHIQEFLAIAEKKENQPVLVHCTHGVHRTGMMVAAYQMSILGYDKARAKAEIKDFGHSDRAVDDIEAFIDAYDPPSRTVYWRPPAR